MNASPQPTVVPRTCDRHDRHEPVLAARPPVEHLDAARAQRHDDEPAQVVGHAAEPGHDRVVERARPAHEADVDRPHRRREPLHRVVPEPEEVGRHLEARGEPGRVQPVQLADRALDEHQVEPPGARDQRLLLGRGAVRRPDALDEVVHVRLEVRLDDDVDGRRRARAPRSIAARARSRAGPGSPGTPRAGRRRRASAGATDPARRAGARPC